MAGACDLVAQPRRAPEPTVFLDQRNKEETSQQPYNQSFTFCSLVFMPRAAASSIMAIL